jgi:hypothetical protein
MPFERLLETVTIIARHRDYPGKQDVIARCLDDIEHRWRQGRLTQLQRLRLYALLVAATAVRRSPAMAL